ncbi:hypothetical protein L207DRAFT_593301 [Hyaloscypha variabilis F]|uniref:Uncharacterized protein n=1 Tax=Hyaloscypha variabilis (strain UAMH 11265 / GT02V1 / F) TaxID=1149755 RepID=A0A2J6QTA2_HYAVF|nr:hypothetical protein L207DRAFT_593301 [Hyaloscypha variabilis F]
MELQLSTSSLQGSLGESESPLAPGPTPDLATQVHQSSTLRGSMIRRPDSQQNSSGSSTIASSSVSTVGVSSASGSSSIVRNLPTAGMVGSPTATLQLPSRWTFLVSGSLATGQRISSVAPSVMLMMQDQVAKWEGNPVHRNWAAATRVSHKRCCETRIVQRLSTARNPPPSENLNGPVIVPLPVSERTPGATPMQGEYYVKTRVRAPTP